MSRLTLTFAAILAAFSVSAQGLSICNEVIGTTGMGASESGLQYAYTLGEPVILTLKKPGINVVLTQGFHQPDLCLPVSTTQNDLWTGWDIQVYPNPATQWLRIQFTAPDSNDLIASVVGLDGKTHIQSINVNPAGLQLDIATLPDGFYHLQLLNAQTGALATVRFVKAN